MQIFVTYFLVDRWSAWALCEKTFVSSGHHHAIILHLLQNFQIRFFTVFPIANWVILLLSVGVHCSSCSLVYSEHCWFFWYSIPVPLLLFVCYKGSVLCCHVCSAWRIVSVLAEFPVAPDYLRTQRCIIKDWIP